RGEYREGAERHSRGSKRLWYHPRARGLRAFSRDAEHQPTEEARSLGRQAAAREPALPLDCEDAGEASRSCSRRRGQEPGRGRAPRPRALARSFRGPGRAAPEHRRAPQGAGRPARLYAESLVRERGLAGPGDVDQLALEVDGEPRATLDGMVELRQPDDCAAQLIGVVVAGLREELLDVERMPLQ